MRRIFKRFKSQTKIKPAEMMAFYLKLKPVKKMAVYLDAEALIRKLHDESLHAHR